MSRPPFIGNYLDFLDDDTASYPGSSELLSIGSSVGKKLGLKKIGVHVEILLTGRRTSFPHAEGDDEEFCFVVEGNPDVWLDGYLHRLGPGDFVAFPSGTGIAHTFMNNSASTVKLLVGGEVTKASGKIIYPLHPDRNQLMKEKGILWEKYPHLTLGPHDGIPQNPLLQKWNFPIMETERLILRPLNLSDASAIFKYASQDLVTKYLPWPTHLTLTESEKFLQFAFASYSQNQLEPMGICLKENSAVVIGTVGAFWNSKPNKVIELGAALSPEHWGKGLTSEALLKLIEVSWTHYDVQRIQARCMVENTQSRRMLTKLGMTYEGKSFSSMYIKGKSRDMEIFSLVLR